MVHCSYCSRQGIFLTLENSQMPLQSDLEMESLQYQVDRWPVM